ncbi:hypothetical protein MRB53_037016 [Persea americana]|nr:hypothetical protein MRB53_037016 [Persea americana]
MLMLDKLMLCSMPSCSSRPDKTGYLVAIRLPADVALRLLTGSQRMLLSPFTPRAFSEQVDYVAAARLSVRSCGARRSSSTS